MFALRNIQFSSDINRRSKMFLNQIQTETGETRSSDQYNQYNQYTEGNLGCIIYKNESKGAKK